MHTCSANSRGVDETTIADSREPCYSFCGTYLCTAAVLDRREVNRQSMTHLAVEAADLRIIKPDEGSGPGTGAMPGPTTGAAAGTTGGGSAVGARRRLDEGRGGAARGGGAAGAHGGGRGKCLS